MLRLWSNYEGRLDIVHVAALIDDSAPANILIALMSGTALTATELATEARGYGADRQFLSDCTRAGYCVPASKAGYKYFSLASTEVAGVLEALIGLVVAGMAHLLSRTGPRDKALL